MLIEDEHSQGCDRHYEKHGGGCVCPTECRDLHEILLNDGTPILPLDHWGHGCPFGQEVLLELETRLGPNPPQVDTEQIVMGESKNSDEKGEDS